MTFNNTIIDLLHIYGNLFNSKHSGFGFRFRCTVINPIICIIFHFIFSCIIGMTNIIIIIIIIINNYISLHCK